MKNPGKFGAAAAVLLSQSFAAAKYAPAVEQVLAEVPTAYEFQSRVRAESSLNYSGQIFRQVLVRELKDQIGKAQRGTYAGTTDQALQALWSYVDFDMNNRFDVEGAVNGESFVNIQVKDFNQNLVELNEIFFSDVTSNGKQILNKLAGNDNPLRRGELKGWGETNFYGIDLTRVDVDGNGDAFIEPEDFLYAVISTAAKNNAEGEDFFIQNGQDRLRISDAAVTEDGVNLAELTEKFLHGALSLSQAAEDYMSANKGLLASNEIEPGSDAIYSGLEHHWDEGFGYFGAARDYLAYTDDQIRAGLANDTNGDGYISLLSEVNYGISTAAAKRDAGAALKNVDFTGDLFSAFVQGRYLITQKPAGYEPAVFDLAAKAILTWEKVIAATVIHYINDTVEAMEKFNTVDYSFTSHAKAWSEMKGYALAFQFSPNSPLTDDQFDRMHELMGVRPVLATASAGAQQAYVSDLLRARDMLQAAYGFDTENVVNW